MPARAVALLLGVAALAACGADEPARDTPGTALPQGSEPVELDPARFSADIDNPYWPMAPGARWVYRETDSSGAVQKVVVTVTDRTRRIANGVEARVVHDLVTEGGQTVEDTYDWYAQDADGNVWYLGEDTTEFEDGRPVSHEGAWEAGVDGAQAGVVMPARPVVGLEYRQEFLAGEAEDRARVLSLDEQAEVPFGHFTGVLLTKDHTPVEPKVLEYKLYARGVGPVLVLSPSGSGGGREELLSFEEP
jgi:hypothetical protein